MGYRLIDGTNWWYHPGGWRGSCERDVGWPTQISPISYFFTWRHRPTFKRCVFIIAFLYLLEIKQPHIHDCEWHNTGSYLVSSNLQGTPPPPQLPFVRPPVLCHPLHLALCLLFGWVLRSWLWGQKELAQPGPAQPAQHQVKCLWQPTAQLLTVIYHHRALDPAQRGGVHKRALVWAQRPLSLHSHTEPNTYFNTYFTSFHILHPQFV